MSNWDGTPANGPQDELAAYRGLAPGWYRDSSNHELARYWDGSMLSEERRRVKGSRDELAPYRGLAAGWYRDRTNPHMARYWDGESWGDELRPVAHEQPHTATQEPASATLESLPSTPAGWYPDPTNEDLVRYWSGTQWTEHTAARA